MTNPQPTPEPLYHKPLWMRCGKNGCDFHFRDFETLLQHTEEVHEMAMEPKKPAWWETRE